MNFLKRIFRNDIESLLLGKIGKKNTVFSDPRLVIDETSRILNEPISKILQFVSSQMKLPVCYELIPFEITLLSSDVGMHIFWEKGFAPVIVNKQLIGVASSNPALLKNLPQSLRGLPIFISSFSSISECLYKSEKNHSNKANLHQDELALAILGLVIEEAKSLNSHKVSIIFSNSNLEYFLESSNGLLSKGTINNDGAEALSSYVKSNRIEEVSINLPTLKISEKFRFREISNGFEILLKADQETVSNSNVLEFPKQKSSLSSSIIYLVDDDKSFLTVTERFLMQHGFVAKSFLSVKECLDSLEGSKAHPFIIVTDMHMNDASGIDLIVALKQSISTSHIPVIALSGDDFGETELRLLESGAEHVVMKRGDPRILLHLIKRFTPALEFRKANQ